MFTEVKAAEVKVGMLIERTPVVFATKAATREDYAPVVEIAQDSILPDYVVLVVKTGNARVVRKDLTVTVLS